MVEVESLERFDALIDAGARSAAHWRLQDIDLTERTEQLRGLDVEGALLLGCTLETEDENDLRARGALVFPQLPHVPVNPYRAELYTPQELYAGLDQSYADTLDARAYAWSRSSKDLGHDLAQALHDHAIDDALTGVAGNLRLVGVMGGHALQRGEPEYVEAARLGRDLTRAGLTVATGGGPGAMEAANLGAYLANHDDDELGKALEVLAAVPSYAPDIGAWAGAAFAVLERWPGGTASVGIPTWFYGHEPPNLFATRIAKYFKNAIREDVLLHLCDAGIVFLPGRAGTVQEVFQDACENYYSDPESLAPMVLVGVEHWTRALPAWPLLEALAAGRPMATHVHLVDSADAVLPHLDPR